MTGGGHCADLGPSSRTSTPLESASSMYLCLVITSKEPVHGLNKSRVPSHNGDTIYRHYCLPVNVPQQCRHLAINMPYYYYFS